MHVADSFPSSEYCWKVEGSVVTVVGNDSILSFHSVMWVHAIVCQCHEEWRLALFWCLVSELQINKLTTYHTSVFVPTVSPVSSVAASPVVQSSYNLYRGDSVPFNWSANEGPGNQFQCTYTRSPNDVLLNVELPHLARSIPCMIGGGYQYLTKQQWSSHLLPPAVVTKECSCECPLVMTSVLYLIGPVIYNSIVNVTGWCSAQMLYAWI